MYDREEQDIINKHRLVLYSSNWSAVLHGEHNEYLRVCGYI